MIPAFKNWGAAAQPYDARFFTLAGANSGTARVTPRAPRFRGRVWVLVDASNSSATFDFERFVKRRRLAVLVGSMTGGNLRGSNGGAFFSVRLPLRSAHRHRPRWAARGARAAHPTPLDRGLRGVRFDGAARARGR